MDILLADNQAERRKALRQLLDQDPDLFVVAEAIEAKDLLKQMAEAGISTLLVNWQLPGLCDDDFLATLCSAPYPSKVVVFDDSREGYQEALDAGADAFVSEEEPAEWLLKTLHRLAGLSPCFPG